MLARLTAAGQLDKTFGADGGQDGTPDGVVSISPGVGDGVAAGLALQKDGKLVVVGHTTSTGGKTSNIAVARLLADGQLSRCAREARNCQEAWGSAWADLQFLLQCSTLTRALRTHKLT